MGNAKWCGQPGMWLQPNGEAKTAMKLSSNLFTQEFGDAPGKVFASPAECQAKCDAEDVRAYARVINAWMRRKVCCFNVVVVSFAILLFFV